METKPFKLVAVATANKLARIVFALMRDATDYAGTPGVTTASARPRTGIEGDNDDRDRRRIPSGPAAIAPQQQGGDVTAPATVPSLKTNP